MRANVVVPASEEVEIALEIGRDRLPHPPKWFESAEEPLDAPVLPGGEGSGALVADSEDPETELE